MNFGWVINQVKADMVEMGHPNDFIGAKVCFFFLISKKCSLFIKDVDYIHYNSIHDIRWIELVFWGLHLFKEKNFASDNWLVSSPFKLEWPFDVQVVSPCLDLVGNTHLLHWASGWWYRSRSPYLWINI